MGKKLSELGLDPTAGPAYEDGAKVRRQEQGAAESLIAEINQYLDDEGYRWAWDTLAGIRETVRAKQYVTSGQYRAVQNIAQGQQRNLGRGRTRRYEGFSR